MNGGTSCQRKKCNGWQNKSRNNDDYGRHSMCNKKKKLQRQSEREREKSNYSIISSRTAETAAARAQQKINTDHTMAVLHYSQV